MGDKGGHLRYTDLKWEDPGFSPITALSSPGMPGLEAGWTEPPSALLQTSYEMMMQCVSRMLAHPLHGELRHWRLQLSRGMTPCGL